MHCNQETFPHSRPFKTHKSGTIVYLVLYQLVIIIKNRDLIKRLKISTFQYHLKQKLLSKWKQKDKVGMSFYNRIWYIPCRVAPSTSQLVFPWCPSFLFGINIILIHCILKKELYCKKNCQTKIFVRKIIQCQNFVNFVQRIFYQPIFV